MTRTWIVENKWTCQSCGAQNLGCGMNCGNCGAKKDPHVAEQRGSPDAVVTDPEMLRQARAGASWVCSYCDDQERDLREECATCGGPRRSTAQVPGSVDLGALAAVVTMLALVMSGLPYRSRSARDKTFGHSLPYRSMAARDVGIPSS